MPDEKFPLRGRVPHGPSPQWNPEGGSRRRGVCLTVSEPLVRWAREEGFVLSRVLEDALRNLQRDDPLKQAEDRVRSLEAELEVARAARTALSARREEAPPAPSPSTPPAVTVRARQAALESLTREFYEQGRERLADRPNLAWLQQRLEQRPELKGVSPETVLAQIWAAAGK
jgi:hypothetical protein